MDIRWLPATAMRAIHAELMAEFGGPEARVDEDLLAATLARPRQRQPYENTKAALAGWVRRHLAA